MSDLGNKEIMARNIKRYMSINNIDRNQICHDLEIKYTTLCDWLNGNTYPRIDKIELMANYFHINKSDLVEDHSSTKNRTSKISILQRAEENEKLSENEIDDILSYAKFKYPEAFNSNE